MLLEGKSKSCDKKGFLWFCDLKSLLAFSAENADAFRKVANVDKESEITRLFRPRPSGECCDALEGNLVKRNNYVGKD